MVAARRSAFIFLRFSSASRFPAFTALCSHSPASLSSPHNRWQTPRTFHERSSASTVFSNRNASSYFRPRMASIARFTVSATLSGRLAYCTRM